VRKGQEGVYYAYSLEGDQRNYRVEITHQVSEKATPTKTKVSGPIVRCKTPFGGRRGP